MIKLSFALLITGNVTFFRLTKTTTDQILTLQKPAIKHFIRHLFINQLLVRNILFCSGCMYAFSSYCFIQQNVTYITALIILNKKLDNIIYKTVDLIMLVPINNKLNLVCLFRIC